MGGENEAAPGLQRNECGNGGLATSQLFLLTLLEASTDMIALQSSLKH